MKNIEKVDSVIEPMLRAARIPGAAIAIVAGGETVLARGYGYRDLDAELAMTADTIYPIASTAKAINATLLGMLADEGRLAWDAPVRNYLPRFRLQDRYISALVTVRDLVAMRTGLPGHDFVYMENPINRAELVDCLAHLSLSGGFRERFQYNDLTVTIAGHIAEIVTGQSWEDLIRRRIFEPLGMNQSEFALPATGNVTRFYHENARRELLSTRCFEVEPIGPAGGSIHSTVQDMARWVAFNLNGGKAAGRQLIEPATLRELHSPCMVMGADAAAPSANAAYGLGWFLDTYNGSARISHTGWLHDVNSCVSLFPEHGIGMVSFINFASSRLATLLNQHAFDLLMGLQPTQTLEQALAAYEKKIESTRARNTAVRRVANTVPSHSLDAYVGSYLHTGYGRIGIGRDGAALRLERNNLVLPLEHWHYDVWVATENDLFEIHKPQPFDRANRLAFETNADGEITAFSIQLEPEAPRARFVKEES